jgi:hypothetical protein
MQESQEVLTFTREGRFSVISYKGGDMAFGVTAIEFVTNNLPDDVLFINTENSSKNRWIPSSRTQAVGDCWIPWCWKRDDFPWRHIEIIDMKTERVLWFIWQERNQICASSSGYVDAPGPAMPGESNTGAAYSLNLGPGTDTLLCYLYVS